MNNQSIILIIIVVVVVVVVVTVALIRQGSAIQQPIVISNPQEFTVTDNIHAIVIEKFRSKDAIVAADT